MAPIVGYWDIRGMAEPIRLLLHYAGVEFENKKYYIGEAPTYDRKEWLDVKYSLGLDFPNLPYYIDDDVKLSQSITIMRYLGKKHGMYPESLSDSLAAETLEQLSRDVCMSLVMFSYNPPDNESFKQMFFARMYEYLKQLSDYLEEKDYFVADKISYADFMLYESIDQASYMVTDALVKYPNLGAFVKRIESLRGVEKYMKSGQYKAWPMYSPYAKWGGSGEAPKRSL